MELFISAALITFGILLALFVTKVAMNILIVTLEVTKKKLDNKIRAEKRARQAAHYADRQRKLEDEAEQVLASNAEIAELVGQIRAIPYIDRTNKTARANNNKRAKLQKTLRELVPNKGIRDVFYA